MPLAPMLARTRALQGRVQVLWLFVRLALRRLVFQLVLR
jgi:hypothetical protein